MNYGALFFEAVIGVLASSSQFRPTWKGGVGVHA
jgi:hypothetical protein